MYRWSHWVPEHRPRGILNILLDPIEKYSRGPCPVGFFGKGRAHRGLPVHNPRERWIHRGGEEGSVVGQDIRIGRRSFQERYAGLGPTGRDWLAGASDRVLNFWYGVDVV